MQVTLFVGIPVWPIMQVKFFFEISTWPIMQVNFCLGIHVKLSFGISVWPIMQVNLTSILFEIRFLSKHNCFLFFFGASGGEKPRLVERGMRNVNPDKKERQPRLLSPRGTKKE